MRDGNMSSAAPSRSPGVPASGPVQPAARRARPRRRDWVAGGVLVVAAVGGQLLTAFDVYLQKEAVPLKKPLAQFDVRALGPRYEKHPATDRIEPISEDMIDSLGTREYTQFFLIDTQAGRTERTRVAHVFITYYTGRPDMVPHVPDECYAAGGYQVVGTNTETVAVSGVGAPHDALPVVVVRALAPPSRRRSTDSSGEIAVTYFFHANGDYVTTRDGVRLKLSNPLQRYAYYAKIEISFSDDSLVNNAGPADTLRALPPLLQVLLPRLLEDHLDVGKLTAPPPAAPAAPK